MRSIVLGVMAAVACGALGLVLVGGSPDAHGGERPAADDAPRFSKSGFDVTQLAPERVDELAKKLTDDQRDVLLHAGTEPPFCAGHLDNKAKGTYSCALCGLPLFRSDTKFESGTGWPSFYEPYDPAHIEEKVDSSYGMVRTEIRCERCAGHLGHVFDDGPPPTGKRYCLNSASLEFHDRDKPVPDSLKPLTKDQRAAIVAKHTVAKHAEAKQPNPAAVKQIDRAKPADTKRSPTK